MSSFHLCRTAGCCHCAFEALMEFVCVMEYECEIITRIQAENWNQYEIYPVMLLVSELKAIILIISTEVKCLNPCIQRKMMPIYWKWLHTYVSNYELYKYIRLFVITWLFYILNKLI